MLRQQVGCRFVHGKMSVDESDANGKQKDDRRNEGKQHMVPDSIYACYVLSQQNERTAVNEQRGRYCKDKARRNTPSFNG